MVLNRIDTQNSIKNLYNMNTKTKENVAEILRLHIPFGELSDEMSCKNPVFMWVSNKFV